MHVAFTEVWFGIEEHIDYFFCLYYCDDTLTEAQDVRMIVLSGQLGELWGCTESRSNVWVAICPDADTDARTADEDAEVVGMIMDVMSDFVAGDWVVESVF